ncbi:Organic solute transporter subunit alpha/Transmembrane protein 184 family-containing protein [Strongyloides ratti]|uniref:Organic solute transporter subunit alpha/Transmembrane protein 184 family-containing protein n=1 Tax=Strongyloides ratti TaxID=34506 RepID=A0A090LIA0_STRRB|nr:Organic solute transporter subunit alpha/Transmembrane protein 184 family-containing protein [Strongyloides ratti]CEF67190.1 Organic solute transporter subunit alpha/Transmembrane protein 184 family-containing protein [Strongyloides ratti]
MFFYPEDRSFGTRDIISTKIPTINGNVNNIYNHSTYLNKSIFKNETLDPPVFSDWLKNMSAADGIILTIASLSVSFVLSVGMGCLYFVRKYISNESSRHAMTWIALMLPVTTTTSLLGMYFPRSASFLHIIGTCLLMICVTMVIRLMKSLFKGEIGIIEYMTLNDINFDLKYLPFFCCTKSPSLKRSKKNFKILTFLVSQTVFVQIIGRMCTIIAFLENSYKHQKIYDISNVTCFISIMISVYASEVLYRVSKKNLSKYKFGLIYIIVHISQTLFNLQEVFINVLQKFNVIEPGFLVYPEIRTLYLASFLFCCEAFILVLILFFAINPSKNRMCDRYISSDEKSSTMTSKAELGELVHMKNEKLINNNNLYSTKYPIKLSDTINVDQGSKKITYFF